MNPKIITISPQYNIDKNNQVEISHYLVDFTITKKNKDDLFEVSGKITYRGELDIRTIQGKIAYEFKNIIQ